MKKTLCDRMIELMSDGKWYSTDELVEKISHRFSDPMYRLRKKGYKFDMRNVPGRKNEFRLVL